MRRAASAVVREEYEIKYEECMLVDIVLVL